MNFLPNDTCANGILKPRIRGANHYGPRGEKPGTFSLHNKVEPVKQKSEYKKPNSIPVNFGYAAFHWQKVGQYENEKGETIPILRNAMNNAERHEFFKPAPLWPHLRTEKRLNGLKTMFNKAWDPNKKEFVNTTLKYPVLIATLEKQLAREKIEYDRVMAMDKARKNEMPKE